MNEQEIVQWAKAYIEAIESAIPSSASDLPWPVERFMNISERQQAEEAWVAILSVLSQEPTDKVVSALAAGPIEDLLVQWGETFIERIEGESQRNPRFRSLLKHVWASGTPIVWQRIERARAGFAEEGQ